MILRSPNWPLVYPLAGGRGFEPTLVPGCALWLEALDRGTITLNGSDVSEWQDKGGNDNHASQATAVNQPVYAATELNSRPSVDFNETSHALTAAAAASINNLWDGGGYYIGVIRKDGSGGGGFGCVMSKENSGSTTGWYMLCSLSRLYMHIKFSTMHGQWSVSSAPAAPFIFEVEYDSDSTSNDAVIRVNGTALTITEDSAPVGTRVSDAADALTVGNRPSLGSNWDGPHGEHCLFSAIPSAGEKAALRSYLSAKWGVLL